MVSAFRIGDLVDVKGEGLCIIVGIESSVEVPDHLKDVVQSVYHLLSASHVLPVTRFASELKSV